MTKLNEHSNFRALVVDDEAAARGIVSFALKQEGFLCDVATDGEKAMTLLADGQYDLLVTDVHMPYMHGHSLVVEVLAGASPPCIIVHTSIDKPWFVKDLILLGVDDVVYKPTDYAVFAAKARGLVERRKVELEALKGADATPELIHQTASEVEPEALAADLSPVEHSELKSKLLDVSKVLPVSHAALNVTNMVSSNSFDAAQVASVVQSDPALAAKVLRLANRPSYNSTGKQITDIKQAVARIGQKRVGEFALAMSAFASLRSDQIPQMDLDLTWLRCVAAGIAVELLVAEGKHTSISEGLLFSALMNSAGRLVLGTHYPKQYEAMVQSCMEDNGALLQHEMLVFPQDHAEVMYDLLADWKIPANVFQPLKYVLKDYTFISSLPEPMRTKVELVKLAILIGQIAVGGWEAWDLVELPPRPVLDRLGIEPLKRIIEQTKAQLPGLADLQSNIQLTPGKGCEKPLAGLQVDYCNLSESPFDFLAEIITSMGVNLTPVNFKLRSLCGSVLVNRFGAVPNPETTEIFKGCDKIVFVRELDKMQYVTGTNTNVGVPCSYAYLQSACRQLARAFSGES